MKTISSSAAFVPYSPNLPLTYAGVQRRGRPTAGQGRVARIAPRLAARTALYGLGSLGADAKGAAASTISYASAGSVVGPIGTAVGAIVGLAMGLFGNKQYLNVAQMNAAEQQEVSAFNQYRAIAGQVAGRDVGYPALNTVFNGAVHSGIFPINKDKQCFHEGCSTYPGNASWSDQAMNGGSSDKNTMPDVVPQAIAAGVLDPRQILQQYWIPAQQAKGNHWAVPSNSIGQQLLTDIIDAYVADHVPNVPYFYAQPVNTALAPVVNAPAPVQQVAVVPAGGYPVPSGYTDTGSLTSDGRKILTANGQYFRFDQYSNGISQMAAPVSTTAPVQTSSIPSGYTNTGQKSPNGLPLLEGPDGSYYTYDGATLAFYMTSTGSTVPPGQATPPTYQPSYGSLDPNTSALINQLIQQGQSQQTAYNAALQQLAAQGQAMTPQLQQQVASQVGSAAGIGAGINPTYIAMGAVMLGLLLFSQHPAAPAVGGRRR